MKLYVLSALNSRFSKMQSNSYVCFYSLNLTIFKMFIFIYFYFFSIKRMDMSFFVNFEKNELKSNQLKIYY